MSDVEWVRTQCAWFGLVDEDGAVLADERQLAGLAADHRALRAAVDALHEAVRAAPETAPALIFDP